MEKTYVPKGQLAGEWYLVNAEGETLGRLASKIAALLLGKQHPNFTPGVDMNDHVVVINASKVSFHPSRLETKMYYRHSGYPGGLKSMNLKTMLEKNPERLIELTVKGMLPKNRMTKRYMDNLKVYAGAEHLHAAQAPKQYEVEK
ncbi:MAG: 50S ribosomal protein L13 [Anaerolineaceae bacterium]|nr:50S ribosomal protein L13 [Anaerolineaceae bacterium]